MCAVAVRSAAGAQHLEAQLSLAAIVNAAVAQGQYFSAALTGAACLFAVLSPLVTHLLYLYMYMLRVVSSGAPAEEHVQC